MVRAGAHEGQAQGDVDAILNAQVLDGDQSLVVVHRHDSIELGGMVRAAARTHEHRVRRERALGIDAGGTGRLHRRSDDVCLLRAEQAPLPGMRIEPGHGDARPRAQYARQ